MGDVTVGAQPGKGEREGSEELTTRQSGEETGRPEGRPYGLGGPGRPLGGPDEERSTAGTDSAEADADGADGTGPDGGGEGGVEGGVGNGAGNGAGSDKAEGAGPEKKHRSFWKELPILVGIALVLALLIKTFLVQAFSIPSDSMQNTLQRGDRVLVDKLTPWFGSKPERGEVVVFHDPDGKWLGPSPDSERSGLGAVLQEGLSFIGLMPSAEENDLIKRVIAVGGDTVACKQDGVVEVNGVKLDESDYLFKGNTPCNDNPFGPIEVPEGRIWVMGDHRNHSQDSRYHQDLPGGGTVSENEVVGRAIVVAWPIDRWSFLSVSDTFDQSGLSSAAVAGTPAALGLAGAVPLVLWRRRRLLGRSRVQARGQGLTAAQTRG